MHDEFDPLNITDRGRLLELIAQRRKGQARIIDEQEMCASLKRRVRGQDDIVERLSSYIRLQWGKERRGKPIASLLFVGPPATGKTEMAKALAEYLFDDEKHMLRFDCSELSGPEGKTRLVGTPLGYVGSAEGGHLTRPVLANPKRLVLFDEIEKAYAGVFDLFLSIMGDGRLTEQGSNKVADFTQSVIVLTSNTQHEAMSNLARQIDDPMELSHSVRSTLRESQAFRPEIISRFDQIYVFKPLPDEVKTEIAALKIAAAAREYGVAIEFIDPLLIAQMMDQGKSSDDARAIARIVDATLGEVLMQARSAGLQRVRITVDQDGHPRIDSETAT